MEERPNQSKAQYHIDPWRVVIALAPLVAVAAFACGINIEAPAQHQGAIQVLRIASWVATVVTLAWLWLVAMMDGAQRTSVVLELRLFVERNSRMPYAANAYSAVSAAITFAATFAMVR